MNYETRFTTNCFRVTDEKAYQDLIAGVPGDIIRSDKTRNGETTHCLCGYTDILWHIPPSKSETVLELVRENAKLFDCYGNEIDYRKDISELDCNNTIETKDGNIVYDIIDEEDPETFFKELQKLLPDNEVFTYTSVGAEGVRYVDAVCVVMTNKNIKWTSTIELTRKMTEEIIRQENKE